jgi:hypothetical protein
MRLETLIEGIASKHPEGIRHPALVTEVLKAGYKTEAPSLSEEVHAATLKLVRQRRLEKDMATRLVRPSK